MSEVVENYYNLLRSLDKCLEEDRGAYISEDWQKDIILSLFTQVENILYEVLPYEIMDKISDDLVTIIDESSLMFETTYYQPDPELAKKYVIFLFEDIEEYIEYKEDEQEDE
ncbi:hypothetical protein [Methanosphaera sp.]|uniref:hypothetical protein n=1 Tax=Methanosphaera sp. TaxID=2666342 RepID=UPI003D8D7E0B